MRQIDADNLWEVLRGEEGAKAIDCTCRNHGTCKWCEENRKHKFRDKKPIEPKEG